MSHGSASSAIVVLAGFALICTGVPWIEGAESELQAAWQAFNDSRYEEAIANADRVIEKFGAAADRLQDELLKKKAPEPPTGSVSDADKKRIFERGLLNDVASAWWIKARSAEALKARGGEKAATYSAMATTAYKSTCKYPHARTWDPQGWFWSPCQDAKKRTGEF